MDLNGETLQKWCRNDVRPDPESLDLNGETLQKWCRNDVQPDPKSMDLNGETACYGSCCLLVVVVEQGFGGGPDPCFGAKHPLGLVFSGCGREAEERDRARRSLKAQLRGTARLPWYATAVRSASPRVFGCGTQAANSEHATAKHCCSARELRTWLPQVEGVPAKRLHQF